MGYYVRSLAWKKKTPSWKVQFISYQREDTKSSSAKKPKKEWDIEKERWRSLGFHSSMTVTEARARARQLNAQIALKRQEERIRKEQFVEDETRKRFESILPIEFVQEFEKRFVRARDRETESGKRRTTHARVVWRAAQGMIVKVGVEPSDWFYYTHEIYDYFYDKKYSVRYIQSILKFANLWGFFICKKMARPFLPIPFPRSYERQRLLEAFYQKTTGARRPSLPLLPSDLKNAALTLNRRNYNWLYLTVWLGLRPQEVDNLENADLWSLETLPNGRKVLWVFQTKIVALPPEDRWKPIPLLFDEQLFALKILQTGIFKRPLVKTVKKYFGPKVDLYGGRKGFSDLMLSRGQVLENISIWMGHSTLERTWRSYKNKRKYHIHY
jgi:hypothetical protein